MNPIKVLLVVYAFPPAGGVGTLRAASLARYLPAEGIQLDVLTTRNPSSVGCDYSLLKDIPAEVTVHRTIMLDLPFGIKKHLKSLLTTSKTHSASTRSASGGTQKPNVIKRFLRDALLPDPQVIWLPVLTHAAHRIVRDRQIDLVLITGAPFSTYLLAKRLRKKFPALPIVLDFRDEWLSTSFGVASFGLSTSERARRFAIRAEAEAVASATAVVAVTEATLREMQSRYPNDSQCKYHYIPNGFDGTRVQKAVSARLRPGGKIVIAYVGTLYNSTEPTTLVEALKSLPTDIRSRYTFRFIGHIELRYRDALLSLGDMVELKGYMPQREALNAMNEADYVLVISHDRLNISAKFYDYLGSGKPILACVHPEGDIRRILDDLRAGWWADSHNVEAVRNLFIEAELRGDWHLSAFKPDEAKIAQYERKVLAKQYANLLHSILDQQSKTATDTQTAKVS